MVPGLALTASATARWSRSTSTPSARLARLITNLGNFKGFTGPEGNKYSKIAFEGGQKCWNGPSRSLTVEVKCGSEGSLSNIIEPSKCEYTGTFRHPAVCEALRHDEL